MNIRIANHPIRLELRTFRPTGGSCAIVHGSEHDTYRYLKTCVHQPSVMAELRRLLAERGARPLASDDDVLHAAAAGIMMERLFLVQAEQVPGAGGTVDGMAQEAPVEALKRPAVRAPAPLPAPCKRQVTEAPPPAPELTAFLEQDVQAAGMEQAAVNATPFCEVCERARREAAGAEAPAP